jgi:hypothetical protein
MTSLKSKLSLTCLIIPLSCVGPKQAQAQNNQADRPASSEAELRERIKSELREEMRREDEERRKAREFEEMKKTVEVLQKQLEQSQQNAQGQANQQKQDTAVQRSSVTSQSTNNQVATGPVPGVRYQIPPQWAGTAAGYVVNYAGYNYLVGNDGTMTYYTGQVYYPNQNTTTNSSPTTTYVQQPMNYVTGSSSTSLYGPTTTTYTVTPNPWTSSYGGYGSGYGHGYGYGYGNPYLEQRRQIEYYRALQQEALLGREITNGVISLINSGKK